jgi:hypothetical protein
LNKQLGLVWEGTDLHDPIKYEYRKQSWW